MYECVCQREQAKYPRAVVHPCSQHWRPSRPADHLETKMYEWEVFPRKMCIWCWKLLDKLKCGAEQKLSIQEYLGRTQTPKASHQFSAESHLVMRKNKVPGSFLWLRIWYLTSLQFGYAMRYSHWVTFVVITEILPKKHRLSKEKMYYLARGSRERIRARGWRIQ